MTVAENYILDSYHRAAVQQARVAQPRGDQRAATQAASRTSTSARRRSTTHAGSLSGGNQQKVVVAREFSRPVKLVIASQPTRGLDVGSIEYIHKRIVEQRDAGRRDPDRQHGARRGARRRRPDRDHAGRTDRRGHRGRRCDLREGRDAHGRCGVRRLRRLLGPILVPFLAIVTAFIVGSIFILITDFDNLSKLGTDPVGAIGGALGEHHQRLQRDGHRRDRRSGQDLGRARRTPTRRAIAAAIRPITETLVAATPLIFTRPRGGDLVPQRRVQHRRRGPVRPRRVRRDRRRRSRSRTRPRRRVILIVSIARRAS